MRLFENSVFFVLLLSSVVSIAGPIYTWQDEQGRIHYSDRPIDAADDAVEVKEIDLDTQVPVAQDNLQPPADNLYSIRNQIEYFDQRKDAERQAWLEEQKLKQSARAQELQAQQLEQWAVQEQQPDTVIINPSPYYRPYYRPYRPYYRHPRPRPHQHGVPSHRPRDQQRRPQGDPTLYNLNQGNPYPTSPFYRQRY